MMKRVFYIIGLILITSCSSEKDNENPQNNEENQEEQNNNNDDDEVVSLNIYKLTETYNDYTYITYYDEEGYIIKNLGMNEGDDENTRPYSLLEYDLDNNLKKIKFYNENDEFVANHRVFEYDTNNKLLKMIDYGDGSHLPYNTLFEYSTNRIDFNEEETDRSGAFIFDDNGRLIKTIHESGPEIFTTHLISYQENQVSNIEILNTGSYYTFETNNTQNPTYKNFLDKPIQYMLSKQYIFDIDFTFDISFLSKTIIKRIESALPFDKIDETTYQYNSSNFPISSITIKADDTTITRTYEYY